MKCTIKVLDEWPRERDYLDQIGELWDILDLVEQMRKAQRDANDMLAQAECYQEAMEYVKKAEELEKEVDEWFDGLNQ